MLQVCASRKGIIYSAAVVCLLGFLLLTHTHTHTFIFSPKPSELVILLSEWPAPLAALYYMVEGMRGLFSRSRLHPVFLSWCPVLPKEPLTQHRSGDLGQEEIAHPVGDLLRKHSPPPPPQREMETAQNFGDVCFSCCVS